MGKGLPEDAAVGDVFLLNYVPNRRRYKVVIKKVTTYSVWADWFREEEDGSFFMVHQSVRETRTLLSFCELVKISSRFEDGFKDLKRFL